nr:hypothetical protein [Tanacetum cinerariifolium]
AATRPAATLTTAATIPTTGTTDTTKAAVPSRGVCKKGEGEVWCTVHSSKEEGGGLFVWSAATIRACLFRGTAATIRAVFGSRISTRVRLVLVVIVVPLDGLHFDDKLHFVEEPVEIVDREAVPLDGLRVDDKLHFIKEPVEIMDRKVKRLK